MTLEDLVKKARDFLPKLKPVENLKSWGELVKSPQLRQEYSSSVIQPKIQQLKESSYGQLGQNLQPQSFAPKITQQVPKINFNTPQISSYLQARSPAQAIPRFQAQVQNLPEPPKAVKILFPMTGGFKPVSSFLTNQMTSGSGPDLGELTRKLSDYNQLPSQEKKETLSMAMGFMPWLAGPTKVTQMTPGLARDILKVRKGASQTEINSAYRNLIKKEAPRTIQDFATKYKTNAARLVYNAKDILLKGFAPKAPTMLKAGEASKITIKPTTAKEITTYSAGDTRYSSPAKNFVQKEFGDKKIIKRIIKPSEIIDTRIPEQKAQLEKVIGKEKLDSLIADTNIGLPATSQTGSQSLFEDASNKLGKHIAISETDKLTKYEGQDVVSYIKPTQATKGVGGVVEEVKPTEPIKLITEPLKAQQARQLKEASKIITTTPTEALDKSVPFTEYKLKTEFIKAAQKNPKSVESFVAMRRMKDGSVRPAIRKDSGVFAPKAVETQPMVDLKGKTGLSYNLRDALFEADNISKEKAVKTGFGIGARTWENSIGSLVEKNDFVVGKSTKFVELMKKHNIQQTNKNMEYLGKVLEKKAKNVPKNFQAATNELRLEWNDTRNRANQIRKSLNKEQIGYLDDYFSHMQKTGFWEKVKSDRATEFIENFDYIIPNAKVNPTAYKRMNLMKDYEKRADVVWDSYHRMVADDIYTSPMIEQLKAFNEVIKGRGLIKLSKVIENTISKGYAGKPGEIDAMFGFNTGTKRRIIIGGINRARAISALGANPVWTTFVQPLSYPTLVIPRTGGLKHGIQNALRGMYDYFLNPQISKQVKSLATYKLKAGSASIGKMGAGDVDRLVKRAARTKIDKANDVVNIYADWMERSVSGGAGASAFREAKRLGMKERDARTFANYIIESTQSAYNAEARPRLLQNVLVRLEAPFQTFSFELYRYSKTLLGKGGGLPVEKADRLNQGLALIAAMLVTNEFTAKITGRRAGTIGSFLPIIGSYVDERVKDVVRIAKKGVGIEDKSLFGGSTGRAPAAPMQDVEGFIRGLDSLIRYGNWQPLRKEAVKWGMGFSGLGGAATVNRFVDGIIANVQGYVGTRSGKVAFPVEGVDKILAPILGPYSTQKGKEYIEGDVRYLSEKQSEEYKGLEGKEREKYYIKIVNKRGDDIEKEKIREQVRETGEEKEFKGILYYRAKQFDSETGEEKFVVKSIKVREPTKEEVYEGLTTAYETSEDAPENIIQKIKVYGTGLFKDPKGVIEAIRSGNPIRKIRGDAVILERQRSLSKLDVGDMATEVDHIIPLALGGTNEESNLQIISKQDNRAKGQVDTYLAKLLDSGEITKKEAQERVLNWRNEIGKLPEPYKGRAFAYLSAEPEIETKKIITSGLEDLEKIYIITDKSTGNKTKIDLSEPIESPELTGQTELDKKLISDYKSKITRRITAISKVYLDGQMSAEDAEKLINYYQSLKSSATGTGTGRKPSYTMPKLKTPTVPSTRVSAPQFKFTKYNLPETEKRVAFRIIPPKESSISEYITR